MFLAKSWWILGFVLSCKTMHPPLAPADNNQRFTLDVKSDVSLVLVLETPTASLTGKGGATRSRRKARSKTCTTRRFGT